MNYHAGFILKVLLLSGGLSVLIKYGGSLLTIPASEALVPIVVLMPSFILAIALGWRSRSGSR